MITRKRLRKDNEVHDPTGAKSQGACGGFCLTFADGLDTRTHVLGNKRASIDRQREPKRDQRCANLDAAAEVEPSKLRGNRARSDDRSGKT